MRDVLLASESIVFFHMRRVELKQSNIATFVILQGIIVLVLNAIEVWVA